MRDRAAEDEYWPRAALITLRFFKAGLAQHEYCCKWGYHVLTAADGVEAQRVASRSGRSIDLLLTDVVMPSRGGRALADDIRRQHANARVLYMSGYPDDTIAHQGLPDATPFLPKPFLPTRS